jgi:DNA-binding response OmpR family regulator
MPKMDGFALYKELQDPKWAKHKDMPILILTSVREEASRRRYELETGRELDADDYIEKPFSPDILLKRVERLLKKNRKS